MVREEDSIGMIRLRYVKNIHEFQAETVPESSIVFRDLRPNNYTYKKPE